MSTSGITSSLLTQIFGSTSTANQFATDLNQLAQDLQSGNLSAAQTDFVTLSQDAQNGATASAATTSTSGITTSLLSNVAASSSGLSSFVGDLNQLGTDLQNGDLSSAQGDMLSLDSVALNAASATSSGATSASTASSTSVTTQENVQDLIQAIVQALSSGDPSAAGSAMLELSSVSSNSQGASYLQQLGDSLGGSSTTSSTVSQLLQDLNGSNPNSSQNLLSLLA